MAVQGIGKSSPRGLERATAIAMLTAGASLLITIVVIASMLLSQPATLAGQASGNLTYGRQDDYALRHAVVAPNTSRQDDYALRHAVVAPSDGR
ncbi:MAG: hypothetical protein H0T59_07005 [Chloroflexi bacterium]|nr:hypothetical protein [Chloroflexota bacterium]